MLVVVLNENAQLKANLSTELIARSVKHACAHHWLRVTDAALLVVACHMSAAASMLLKAP